VADDADEHDHEDVAFERCEVDEAVVGALDATHPPLARNLRLARRFAELSDDERTGLVASQREVEAFAAWCPGYHSEGDACAACGEPTAPLFRDVTSRGALAYAAFVDDVPVHPTRACLDGFAKKHPKRAPQLLDRLRREHARDLARPSARMSQFFRADLLERSPFGLEDWANSVAEANPQMGKAGRRDVERLLQLVHRRLFH
jgi:hypothetical protein